MAAGYRVNLEQRTLRNRAYRRVLYTAPGLQLVLMSLEPGSSIGWESHSRTSQFIRVEAGRARVDMGGSKRYLSAGDAAVIPAGTRHNVTNVSPLGRLQLYTIYSRQEHRPGLVQQRQ